MDYETQERIHLKIREISYYLVIALVSIVSLVIIPLLSSQAEIEFPSTTMEWLQWAVIRGSIVVCNLLFYFLFMQQAKINVKDNEKFKEANEILENTKISKELKPKSPKAWKFKQYGSKTITIIITTAISTVTLTNAIINFDLVVFMSDVLTIGMGLVFGFVQMRIAEEYWTDEYWRYAKVKEKEFKDGTSIS